MGGSSKQSWWYQFLCVCVFLPVPGGLVSLSLKCPHCRSVIIHPSASWEYLFVFPKVFGQFQAAVLFIFKSQNLFLCLFYRKIFIFHLFCVLECLTVRPQFHLIVALRPGYIFSRDVWVHSVTVAGHCNQNLNPSGQSVPEEVTPTGRRLGLMRGQEE